MKTIKNIYCIFSFLFFAWLALSWLEIIFKHVTSGATYSDFNLITNALYYFEINW